MKKILANPYLLVLLRLILGFVFLYAGAVKIISPVKFGESIANYQLLSQFWINLIAVYLPWMEIVAGILLISGTAVKENALILNVLLVVFIATAVISLLRGLDIECGCFGSGSVKIGMSKILENMLLLIIGLNLMINGKDVFSLRKD